MPVRLTHVMSSAEYFELTDDAVAKGYYRNDRRILLPGMAWEMDWIFDPSGKRQSGGLVMMIKSPSDANRNYLSEFYWQAWADKRPPICVVCPNGVTWNIDQTSRDGPGWKVTGTIPLITCNPSIVVTGYHGRLIDGVFSDDLEGRGPNGIVAPLPEGRRNDT